MQYNEVIGWEIVLTETNEREYIMSKATNKATKTNVAVDTNKETIVAAAAPGNPTPRVELISRGTDSKAAKANSIFAGMFAMSPVPARKDILARFVGEAGCTPKGAATYLQNFKKAAGITAPQIAAKAAETATA